MSDSGAPHQSINAVEQVRVLLERIDDEGESHFLKVIVRQPESIAHALRELGGHLLATIVAQDARQMIRTDPSRARERTKADA